MTEVDYQAIEAYALAEVAKHAPELEAAALVNTEKVITILKHLDDFHISSPFLFIQSLNGFFRCRFGNLLQETEHFLPCLFSP